MFQQLNVQTTDLFPSPIQTLNNAPSGALFFEDETRPFNEKPRVENILASYVSRNVINNIDWSKVGCISFPDKLFGLPALIYRNVNDMGLVINYNICRININTENRSLSIPDINDFVACVIYGLNKLYLCQLEDENDLRNISFAFSSYIYSLVLKLYMRDFDFLHIRDQELAILFFACSKFVLNNMVLFTGNMDAQALGFVSSFFFKSVAKYDVRVNLKKIPLDYNFSSFEDIFNYINDNTTIRDIKINDFRSRIIQTLSISGLVAMNCGLELAAYMGTSKVSSQIINSRAANIYPPAYGLIQSVINKMTETLKQGNVDNNGDEEYYLDRYKNTEPISLKIRR